MPNLARQIKSEWTVAVKGANWVIYTYPTTGNARLLYGLVAFSGNKSKPDYHYGYPTQEALELAIDNFAGQYAARSERKAIKLSAKREARQNVNHGFVVGAIVYTAWGWEQTNTEFYQIVSVSPSKKSIVVREIASKKVPGTEGFMSCSIVPVPGQFVGQELKVTLSPDTSGNWHAKVKNHCAWICEPGKTYSISWYG